VSTPDISVVVFDLGGVLLQLRDARSNFGFDADDAAFNETWLKSKSVRRFERGEIDHDAFAAQVVKELYLPYGNDEFLQRFERWPKALYPGVCDLIDTLSGRVQTALLSNTNAVHWNRSDIGERLRHRLDHCFLSFETGELKPDPSSFIQLLDKLQCESRQALFFDDNALNIEAALELGFRAHLTRGAGELHEQIAQTGLLAGTTQ